MKIIMIDHIKGLGNVGEIVQVKDGFARNYLLPKKKGMLANDANMALVETKRDELKAKADQRLAEAKTRAESVGALGTLSVSTRASDEGKLYGAVSANNVVELLANAGIEVKPQEVVMPKEQIRLVGEYVIVLDLHSEVSCELSLHVQAEQS